MLTGKHLINGSWITGGADVESANLDSTTFCEGRPEEVELATTAAEDAFSSYAYTSRAERAAFLDQISIELDNLADELTAVGSKESSLPAARLMGERGRTTAQLQMFARHIEQGDYLDRRHDPALPDREPAPRSELRLVQRPLGPVAVFGASNFPLAFSVAGGDTASALAAGCPVVVKGHPAHPGTGELAALAIDRARVACGLHPGVFNFVQAGNRAAGEALVQHPLIQAVGFTGSLGAGRALFDLCALRPTPIPFYGELGSINPVFVLDHALSTRGATIAADWAASLTLGAGQFCTNPGVLVLVKGAAADAFKESAVQALHGAQPQAMLTPGIADAFANGVRGVMNTANVATLTVGEGASGSGAAALFVTSGENFIANPGLAEEVFGPLALIVEAEDQDQMLAIAQGLEGQLTATLQLDDVDQQAARRLVPVLERRAGRLLANGFPTGVEVCDAMHHGGPYPASTNFGATSVGTMAIRRFLRPVCYQDIPSALLPADLLSQ